MKMVIFLYIYPSVVTLSSVRTLWKQSSGGSPALHNKWDRRVRAVYTLFPAQLCCVQKGNTNTSNASKDDTYPMQPHALFKSLWCMQHLAPKGAEALKTAKQLFVLDLWTHLLQARSSWHSLNLLSDLSSGWLHIAQHKLNELYLFSVPTRPGRCSCPGAGARPWPPRPGALCRRGDAE